MQDKTIKSYKGFNKDMTCRGFQYEVGKTYKHEGKVEACDSGFHACEYPLDVFRYYEPAKSVFCEVEQSGEISKHGNDSKVASSEITIKGSLDIHGIVKAAIEYTTSRTKPIKGNNCKKEKGAASNSGDYGAASNSGDYGAASNSGTRGAASNSGYQGAASNSGDYGAASNSGTGGAASNSGTRGAASNSGYQGAASNSGYQGAASNSGDYGAASNSGYQGAASSVGKDGAATASGYEGKVMGSNGNALFLVERNNDYEIINVWSGIVGKNGVKENVWYMLKNGELTEI